MNTKFHIFLSIFCAPSNLQQIYQSQYKKQNFINRMLYFMISKCFRFCIVTNSLRHSIIAD